MLSWISHVLQIAASSLTVVKEGRHEAYDRVWQRWLGYCTHVGYGRDPLLTVLPDIERDLVTKSFLQCYRTSKWAPDGSITGVRESPLGVGTIHQAASHLAAAFRGHIGESPLHVKGGTHLRPFVRQLLKAFENVDPPTRQQRAVTPQLLRAMFETAEADRPEAHDNVLSITAELAIVGFSFAMRSCEFTATPNPGRTKIIHLWGIVFRDKEHNVLEHNDPRLSDVAERMTVTFQNQKTGQKMDKRTHQRTKDPVLCPVRRLASIVDRIYRRVRGANQDTKVNAAFPATRTLHITSDLLRKHMWNMCTLLGGANTFGFNAADVGTKSLRSRAAMSLFLMNHPVHKIMILGEVVV